MTDRRLLTILGSLAALVVVIFFVSLMQGERRTQPSFPVARITDPARGADAPAVTIIEFGDFQCEFCKDQDEEFAKLLAAYPDAVRIVWKDLPLVELHAEAENAAIAARCAQNQGKFWEYHDKLFAAQDQFGTDRYRAIAEELSIDLDLFAACYNAAQPGPLIAENQAEARRVGVASTPYFFLNGQPLDRVVSYEELLPFIRAATGT